MRDLKTGDVVVTAFPFAEGHTIKIRPAVVYAGPWTIHNFTICWMLMITSAKRPRWPDDVEILDFPGAGLPGASLVRPLKITCIDARNILQKLGTLDGKTLTAVRKSIRAHVS